jgi:hypothetical protein
MGNGARSHGALGNGEWGFEEGERGKALMNAQLPRSHVPNSQFPRSQFPIPNASVRACPIPKDVNVDTHWTAFYTSGL